MRHNIIYMKYTYISVLKTNIFFIFNVSAPTCIVTLYEHFAQPLFVFRRILSGPAKMIVQLVPTYPVKRFTQTLLAKPEKTLSVTM